MLYFDTHAHLGLINEDPIDQIIISREAQKAGVKAIISVTNSLMDFDQVYKNLKTSSNVYFAVGISPSEVVHTYKDWDIKLEEALTLDRVVALGETGLDYFKKFGDKKSQVELFIKQLEMAEKVNLPVIIHNRDAGNDVLEILRNRIPSKGGVLHCYSEDWEYAKKALDLNLYISFAGNVTYRNVRNLHDTVRNMPLDRMVIETESPFMVPAAYRGKRNKPVYIHSIAEFIAQLRGMPVEEVSEILFKNSCKLFGLDL